jgi:hypothetical protein
MVDVPGAHVVTYHHAPPDEVLQIWLDTCNQEEHRVLRFWATAIKRIKTSVGYRHLLYLQRLSFAKFANTTQNVVFRATCIKRDP